MMARVMKQIGLGLMVGAWVGAIAACRNASDTAEQPTPTPEPTPTEEIQSAPEKPDQPDATVPAETPTPAATATPATPDQATAPAPMPVPPLPAECSNPQTQTEMNRCAQSEYEQADVKLNNVYQDVKAAVSAQQADQLVAAEQAWLTFRDRYCDFVQSEYAGGSIQPTVYYGCLTQLTRDRTAELQQAQSVAASYAAADQELNAVYQDLMGYLDPGEKDLLTDAQLAWLDYRDLHCAFEAGDESACLAQVTQTRVQQLQEQLDVQSL